MNIKIREYTTEDAKAASEIWNQVVDDGEAFPQEEDLTEESGDAFFNDMIFLLCFYEQDHMDSDLLPLIS